ncbi:hypothetical protein MJT46_017241 [Ovis ammon polii x Ovis aries]|nr:hypothetical protein MJT46_017241 [Ovis ammon polii x Ovis aries]
MRGEKQTSEEKNTVTTMTELSPTAGKNSQDIQGDEKLSPRKALSICSTRYGIAFIVHLCNFIIMAQNIIMNITMVAMVNNTSHQPSFNGSTEGLPVDSFGDPNNSPKSLPARAPVYDWNPQIQGIIFSAINYGMILTLAPSGYLAGRVGTKRVVGAALLGSSLLVLFTPLAADFGLVFLIATRILQGISLGLGYGGQFAIWERWSPPHERSRLCGIAVSGLLLGTCIAILLGGIISQTLGWPSVFYVFGNVPSSTFLLILPFVASNYIIAVSLLTLSCGLGLLCQPGVYINALDIAPRHSSFLMGASRAFAQISAVLAPTVSGFLLSQGIENKPFSKKKNNHNTIMQVDNQVSPRKVPYFCSVRYGIAVFLLLCNVIIMSQRVCMSLTMIAMVNSTEPHGLSNTSTKELQDNIKNPVYNWSTEIQGIMLSSIFYGVLISQIPAGYLSGIYSLKKMIGFALLFSSLFTLLLPLAAEFGEILVIICRVIKGMFQVSSSTLIKVPIKAMLKSTPLWVISLCNFAFFWSNTFLSIYTPIYIDYKLHVDVKENGLLSSLPHLFAWIFGVLAGYMADIFQTRNTFSLVTIRKLFTSLGLLLPSLFSLCLLYLSYNFYATIIFLILANSTGSFAMGGLMINVLDIAPRYYGFLRGVTNVIGLTGGLIASTVTGIILSEDAESPWLKIFLLMIANNMISLIFYLIFGKAEVQDWAKERQNTYL